MPQADPETIQREIEQTRAQLAETVDAIADKVSPKRVTSRTVAQVKDKISYTFGHDFGEGSGDDGPASNATSLRWEGSGAPSPALAAAGKFYAEKVQPRQKQIAAGAVGLLLVVRRLRKRHKAKVAQKAFERFERWAERRDYRDDRREQWR